MTATHSSTETRFAFTAKRGVLESLCKATALAMPKRPAVPILAGMVLEAHNGTVTGRTFDYDTSVSVIVDGAVDVSDGRVLVSHRDMQNLLTTIGKGHTKRVADDVDVTIVGDADGDVVLVADGYTIPVGLDVGSIDDYPALPPQAATAVSVDRAAFTAQLSRLMPAVSRDPLVPRLMGVQIITGHDNLTLYATDRFRAATVTLPASVTAHSPTALLPGRLLSSLSRLVDGDTIRFGFPDRPQGVATVVSGNVTVTMRTAGEDGDFPKVATLFPSETATAITVESPRTALAQAVERAGRLTARNCPLRVRLSSTGVTVLPTIDGGDQTKVSAPEIAANVTTANQSDAEDGPWQIGVNPQYLGEALKAFTTETVTLRFTNPSKPMLLTDDDPATYRHLLMPIRLVN